MSDNKLVKTVIEAATLTGLAAGIGWAAKKVVKENFTLDPSSSAMNYVKFSVVMAGSIALRQYLEDQKIFPTNEKWPLNKNMASIAIMTGGAIANAVVFTRCNYLAKYLSGDSAAVMEKERERHDRALEAYQAAHAKYMRDRTKLLDWIVTNAEMKA